MQLVVLKRIDKCINDFAINELLVIAWLVLPAADCVNEMYDFVAVALLFELENYALDDAEELLLNTLLNITAAAFETGKVVRSTALVHQKAAHEPLKGIVENFFSTYRLHSELDDLKAS